MCFPDVNVSLVTLEMGQIATNSTHASIMTIVVDVMSMGFVGISVKETRRALASNSTQVLDFSLNSFFVYCFS